MADVHGPGDQLRHLQIRYHLKSKYAHLPNGAMNAAAGMLVQSATGIWPGSNFWVPHTDSY